MEDSEEKKYNDKVKIIIAVLFSSLITFCITILVYGHYLSSKGLMVNSYESTGNISEDIDLIRTYIDNYYKGDIDENVLREGALKGYVAGLGDEYTEYMDAKEMDSLNSSISNTVGIGAYLLETKDSEYTVIAGTLEESPAEKAGLKAGDKIKEVNFENVAGKGSEYVSSKIKTGPAGSSVKIKVIREEQEIEFDIERAEIRYYKIKHEMLENNIGYVDFPSFTDTSYSEFKEAYEDLKNNGAKSLIIDLRNNTGGRLDQALEIADLFVESGKTIIVVEDKYGNKIDSKSKADKTIDMPVVVLVNGYTASASEILTCMLKDYEIAKVVGTKTFGKGLIQNVYENVLGKDSKAALKITTAEYYSPNGNKINKVGIEPNEVVENTDEDDDKQLQRAIELLK